MVTNDALSTKVFLKVLRVLYQDPWTKTKYIYIYIYISSVQSLSHVQLFAILWTVACQASLSITNSRSLLNLMSIGLVIPFNHLILCYLLLLLPSVFPSIRIISSHRVAKVLEFQLQHQSFQ